jgi:hypothetical protein
LQERQQQQGKITASTPTTLGTPAIAGRQATAVTTASSNSSDSNSMAARNIRNESNNRTVNTVETQAKAGTLAKVVKPATAYREANYSRAPKLTLEMTAATGAIGTSKMPSAIVRPDSVWESQQQYSKEAMQQYPAATLAASG